MIDPQAANYGRARYGQIAPRQSGEMQNYQKRMRNPIMGALQGGTAEQAQQAQPPQDTQPVAPMRSALARPDVMPRPSGPQYTEAPLAKDPGMASGQMTPTASQMAPPTGKPMSTHNQAFTQMNQLAMKNRGQTDFGKGGWQGGVNAIGSTLNVKSPFGAALGIQRRAPGSQNDQSVQNAQQMLQNTYQQSLGRQASPEELQAQLAGQGLQGGDRWVGQKGLSAIQQSIQQSPEAQAYAQQGAAPNAPMGSQQQQAPQGLPTANTAYEEYLGELDEGEPPMSYGQFEALFSQIPPEQLAQIAGDSQPQAAPQFARQGFNGINLDMVGQQGASPMGLLGFNTERAFAGGDEKSMKDALGRAFSTNPIDLRGKSKQEVGAYLASPEFEAHLAQSGLQKGVHWDVSPDEYDIIMVNSAERGWEPVDVVGNAGSGDAVWTYQALQDAQAGGANPMQTALMQGVDPTNGLPLQAGNDGDAYWEQILAQLQQDTEEQRKQNPYLFTQDM